MAVYIANIYHMPKTKAHFNYAVMQSWRPTEGIIQLKDLAPKYPLFQRYLELKREGDWNSNTFNNIYVPQFLRDLRSNPRSVDALDRIVELCSIGVDVALGCSCLDETLCHRSILAGILSGLGCEVITETGHDYSEMYLNYMRIK